MNCLNVNTDSSKSWPKKSKKSIELPPCGGLLLAELVVDGDEGLDNGHGRLLEELHLLVVEGLGVGPALDGLLAEQRGVDRKRALLAVLHELGQVEHRLGYLRQIANHQSLQGGNSMGFRIA